MNKQWNDIMLPLPNEAADVAASETRIKRNRSLFYHRIHELEVRFNGFIKIAM